jgi:hypothetical protein
MVEGPIPCYVYHTLTVSHGFWLIDHERLPAVRPRLYIESLAQEFVLYTDNLKFSIFILSLFEPSPPAFIGCCNTISCKPFGGLVALCAQMRRECLPLDRRYLSDIVSYATSLSAYLGS